MVQLSKGHVALCAGVLAALVARACKPDCALLPSTLLSRVWRFVRRKMASLEKSHVELLKGNDALLTSQELGLVKMLIDEGQGHVVAFWAAAGANDAAKKRLVKQLVALDATYPGGLRAYIANARRLLEDARLSVNPYEGYEARMPDGLELSLMGGRERVRAYERLGMQAVRHTAFVLVAGGLGERLGYSGIKVALPYQLATGTSFLEFYIRTILHLQRLSGAPSPLPLAIMVSDDTHDATLALLEHNDYFGSNSQQVRLVRQGKVPCLEDNAARLAMGSEDPYLLQTKPHGHGDVHMLLHQSGLAAEWLAKGLKWVAFFQDTNAMVFRGLLPTLGASQEKDWDMNNLCVPRFAKEAIGAICHLVHPEKQDMTINVEYNQLDAMLRASGYADGDVNTSSGYSPFPGNINQLVVKLETYVRVLRDTGGIVAEFVNPKYKDETRTVFKKAARLECMMQDLPKSLPSGAAVGYTLVKEVWATYSPVKNSPSEARAKAKSRAPTHSATQGELDVYGCNARLLEEMGVVIEAPDRRLFNGLSLHVPPQIVLGPGLNATLDHLQEAFLEPKKVKITARSSLVLEGADIKIGRLDLDGALVVQVEQGASCHLKSLVVRNAGWKLVPVDEESDDVPEVYRIRGFKLQKQQCCHIIVRSGHTTLDNVEEANVYVEYGMKEPERRSWCPPEDPF